MNIEEARKLKKFQIIHYYSDTLLKSEGKKCVEWIISTRIKTWKLNPTKIEFSARKLTYENGIFPIIGHFTYSELSLIHTKENCPLKNKEE
ncbi:MAG: hypothetical protein AABY07_10220 [Nanoarchaeota archaeon]|mgnify:FL=1